MHSTVVIYMCHVINKANKLDFTQVPNTGEYRVKSTDVQNARDHIWAMAWPRWMQHHKPTKCRNIYL